MVKMRSCGDYLAPFIGMNGLGIIVVVEDKDLRGKILNSFIVLF